MTLGGFWGRRGEGEGHGVCMCEFFVAGVVIVASWAVGVDAEESSPRRRAYVGRVTCGCSTEALLPLLCSHAGTGDCEWGRTCAPGSPLKVEPCRACVGLEGERTGMRAVRGRMWDVWAVSYLTSLPVIRW